MPKIIFALVGEDKKHVCNSVPRVGCDKLYPITSKDYEKTVERDLRGEGLSSAIAIEAPIIIDPYGLNYKLNKDVEKIVEKIHSEQVKDNEIFVNISGGTNFMVATATLAAAITKVNTYYVAKKSAKSPESGGIIYFKMGDMIKDTSELGDIQKEILKILLDKESNNLNGTAIREMTNNGIAEELADRHGGKRKCNNTIAYHVHLLEGEKLVSTEKDGRVFVAHLTDEGRIKALLLG